MSSDESGDAARPLLDLRERPGYTQHKRSHVKAKVRLLFHIQNPRRRGPATIPDIANERLHILGLRYIALSRLAHGYRKIQRKAYTLYHCARLPAFLDFVGDINERLSFFSVAHGFRHIPQISFTDYLESRYGYYTMRDICKVTQYNWYWKANRGPPFPHRNTSWCPRTLASYCGYTIRARQPHRQSQNRVKYKCSDIQRLLYQLCNLNYVSENPFRVVEVTSATVNTVCGRLFQWWHVHFLGTCCRERPP